MTAAIPCQDCTKIPGYVNVYQCTIHGSWSRGRMILRQFNRASTWARYERAGAAVLARAMPTVKRTQTARSTT